MRQRLVLRWTPYNVAHIVRHGARQGEVDEVAASYGLIDPTYGGRYLIVGPTKAGRILSVVVEPEGAGVYLVVTARPASRRERRRLERATEGAS